MLVPGPADGGLGGLLPRPALPAALVRDLKAQCPAVVLASNPARMRWGSQTVMLFRCDLLARLQAHSLLPAAGRPSVSHVCGMSARTYGLSCVGHEHVRQQAGPCSLKCVSCELAHFGPAVSCVVMAHRAGAVQPAWQSAG